MHKICTFFFTNFSSGDNIPTVGQFESFGNNAGFASLLEQEVGVGSAIGGAATSAAVVDGGVDTPIWLRYEPFILHVMCRSLKSASVLMALARPSFKNVGLTSWNTGGGGGQVDTFEEDETATAATSSDVGGGGSVNSKNQQCKGGGPRYLVAIWGDEGLDMPLSLPSSPGRGLFYNPDDADGTTNAEWLAQLVNERHRRNWRKVERFVESMKSLEEGRAVDVDYDNLHGGMNDLDVNGEYDDYDESVNGPIGSSPKNAASELPIPRSYDVVGDVAVLNTIPEGDEETQRKVGEWIMSRNKAIKVRTVNYVSLHAMWYHEYSFSSLPLHTLSIDRYV